MIANLNQELDFAYKKNIPIFEVIMNYLGSTVNNLRLPPNVIRLYKNAKDLFSQMNFEYEEEDHMRKIVHAAGVRVAVFWGCISLQLRTGICKWF